MDRVTKTVALIDGRIVPTDSIEWMHECARRHAHVVTMRSLSLQQRRDYIADVGRSEGSESARRLAEAYAMDWQERRRGA